MKTAQLNQQVPDFIASGTDHSRIQLSQFLGQKVVLFFYPKNGTPSCIIENQDFAANHAKFAKKSTVIIGINRDSAESNDLFKKSLNLPFPLVSDSNDAVCNLFGVIVPQEKFGQTIHSLQRSTFLIDEKGSLIYEWRNVGVKEHVHHIISLLDYIDQIKQANVS